MCRPKLFATLLAVFVSAIPVLSAPTVSPRIDVMPLPASVIPAEGRLPVTAAFAVALRGHDDARLRAGLARALRRAEERTGLTFARTPQAEYAFAGEPSAATLVIDCAAAAAAVPEFGEDESYTLEVNSGQAVLAAANGRGVLHGLETMLQLLRSDADGWFLPALRIDDRPRFPWRGLMIDVCRHWQPAEVIRRNLDAMALAKLNVLHLHLTEDQGFRIESRRFPRLHELGSDGQFFTQAEMRELIAYAAERGIRVVPEFDIPGHATSWLVGHPEIGSAPGPYAIERRWGIFDPVLDPTNPRTYEILEGFLAEMAALFPDPYLHIGGDENNGVHWTANAAIQQHIREHGLVDNAGLHAQFNNRIHAMLARGGKRLVGWDEILHPDLAAGSVVHSWRGPEGIAAATARGFATILSNGYYIDLGHPAAAHYLNDPIPADSTLTAEQRRLVLGGEATMWAEWVSPETIDSRIWPRTAAIAERLWSPPEVRDIDDMYRRLAVVARRLEERGSRHESYLPPALRRLAGDDASADELAALRRFVDLLEPVKLYQRGEHQPDSTQFTPLTGLVDCARPDSAPARAFAAAVAAWRAEPSAEHLVALRESLREFAALGAQVHDGLGARAVRLREAQPLAAVLRDSSALALEAVGFLERGEHPPAGWRESTLATLAAAARPQAAVEFPHLTAVRTLIESAAAQP